MSWFDKRNKATNDKQDQFRRSRGLVLFDSVQDAIKAEKIVNKNNNYCRLVAPPPELRKGCDLALEINLVEQAVIERILQEQVPYNEVTPFTGTKELLDIVKVYEYDGYTMVKAGNMKLTFEDSSGIVVNTSGGGCPDIPFLHLELVGRKLNEIPRPRDIGRTLCALMLDRAAAGALEIWEGRTGTSKC